MRRSTERVSAGVLSVDTWSPSADDDETFRYVDIGSIDRESKRIIAASELSVSDAPSRARQRLRADDVLVSTVRPNLNAVALVPSDLDGSIGSTGFTVLRADSRRLLPRFLYYWVRSPYFVADMMRKATGASYPAVSDRIVLDSEMPMPPLAEQRRIADILDRAEALRAKRREGIELLNEFVVVSFHDVFGDPSRNPNGWPVGPLGELIESANYGTSQKAGREGEWPVLRMNNITYAGELDLRDLKYLHLAEKDVEKYTVCDGDVLFNRTNSAELVGKTTIFRGSSPMAYAGYLVRLRTNKLALPEYVSALLNSPWGKRTLRAMCKSIIGMANINATEIQALRVPKPPLALQQEFARRIAAIDRLKAAQRASLAEMDALFASLQQRAFRGEL